MTIPIGVNYIDFYNAAKLKGIKVTSRFKGVSISKINSGKDICWRMQFTKNGVRGNIYYPFTYKGECEAGEKYQQLNK